MPHVSAAVLAVVFALTGAVLITLAWLSWMEKLPKNQFAGVRTPTTMGSDKAFRLANKVAAPATAAGGGALLLVALGVLALPSVVAVVAVSALGGLAVLVLVGYGARAGVQAAQRLEALTPAAPSCSMAAACGGGGCGAGGGKLCGP